MSGIKYLPLLPGSYTVSEGFEPPNRPNHHGVDLAADYGTPIYATADGYMSHVGVNDDPEGYGSWLSIDSQKEWQLDFTFGHMPPSSMINPRTGQTWRPGDEVRAGDKIAEVGSEGGSTGPHLHFETSGPPGRFGGPWLNPTNVWLRDATVPVPVDPKPAEPAPNVPAVKSPGGYQVVDGLPIGCGFTRGHAPRVRIYIHSTENQDWITDAEDVAAYQARKQDGSYHDLIDDNKILNTVSRDNTAWGVLADNPVSIQIALVLTSGTVEQWTGPNPNGESRPKTREQWLKHEKMLDMLAWRISDYTKSENIPLDRVDIVGVSLNRKGVSSHNNYTYGSVKLRGYKDGSHWDIPDTFPYDVVLGAAAAYAGQPYTPPAPPNPDDYPLSWDGAHGREYWGPLEGNEWSISNRYGNESEASKKGLTRWQMALGIPATGVYDDSTRDAAVKMQQLKGWPVSGYVWKGEWDAVIKEGWRFPAPEVVEALPTPAPVTPKPYSPINPGTKTGRSRKVKNVTGRGFSDKFGVGGTDLGVMCRTPSGRILAVFGDTFLHDGVGGPDWRAPVALFSDTKDLDKGLEWHEASGEDPKYAKQLLWYRHDNGEFSTILPTDVITVGDKIYLHVMVNAGLMNVIRTELWRSDDDGKSWVNTGVRIPGDLHHNLAQMITWDVHPNGYVYVMSTSFKRADPLILRRVPHDKIEDLNAYEGWGWANGSWAWGNAPTPILEGASSAGKFGELCLRWIQGQWVLVNFDASNSGGYDIDVRVFASITDNLYTARKSSPIRGVSWGMEGDDAVSQLYGPSIVPGSALDAGFHILVSQWNTMPGGNNWPYRAMQFKIPVDPAIPPLQGEWKPKPTEVSPPNPPEPERVTPAPVPAPNTPQPPPTGLPHPWPEQIPPVPAPSGFWKALAEFFARLFKKG